jgi:predicted Zn-dependent protease
MLRFVVDNDELAAVLAHEIAHNALGHIQAQQQSRIDASFGAIVDTSAAVRAMNARGEAGRQPLDLGSLVFSQAQERDADDVAMYLLVRAGRPIGEVTNLWRHMAQNNPTNVKYVGMHPTTKPRLARLERAERDMPPKFARGEMPTPAVTNANVLDAAESVAMYELSAGDSVSYTFGPPVPREGLTLVEVRRRALQAYQDGNEALELRLYALAEARYREAVLYDGSEARYHAALGSTLLKRGKRSEAEAVLSAAVLLDVDNAEYRRLLVAARQRER